MSTKLEDRPARAESDPDGDEDEEGVEPSPPDDDDDDEVAEDDEQTPEPPEAAALQQSSETMIRHLEREHGRHERALRKIMGEAFEGYTDCPICSSMGYVFQSPLSEDTSVELCPACRGFGMRRTPSLVPEHTARQCMTCLGNGYIDRPQEPVAPVVSITPTPTNAAAAAVPAELVDQLKAAGYTVLPPFVPPTTSA